MRLPAPAKINLFLRVGPIRADGFHPLVTWMSIVGLFDTLKFTEASDDALEKDHEDLDLTPRGAAPGEPGAHPVGARITLRCDDPRLPTDSSNLVARAALTLARLIGGFGETPPSARRVPFNHPLLAIDLQKQIPTGGGLGGGSSDAATALLALNRLWNLNLPLDELSRLAAELGSDVPFFLHGPSSICTGRGEIVRPIARPAPRACVLILPGMHVATGRVYARFDQQADQHTADRFKQAERDMSEYERWPRLPAEQLLPRLFNDLEPPTFAMHPELAALREAAEKELARPVRMSGSGSTLFTLYDDVTEAESAARRFSAVRKVPAVASTLSKAVEEDGHDRSNSSAAQ